MRIVAMLVLATMLHVDANAKSGLGVLHDYKDWVVGCDNTRRCEAQGYASDGEQPAAITVTRDAGPARTPVVSFVYDPFDDRVLDPRMWKVQPLTVEAGTLRFHLQAEPGAHGATVPPGHVRALISRALDLDELRLSMGDMGDKRWSVSLAGAKAALLKMDELQGRVGTPGALVHKGSRAEAAVPNPAAPPAPRPARLPETTQRDRDLEPRIRAVLPHDTSDCPHFDPTERLSLVIRVTPTSLLVSHVCWRGAYQWGGRLWQVDDQPPFRVRPVGLPGPSGEDAELLVGESILASSNELRIHHAAKSRGIGDCYVSREWIWTERGFALLNAAESVCKGFAGGLPITLWRTR